MKLTDLKCYVLNEIFNFPSTIINSPLQTLMLFCKITFMYILDYKFNYVKNRTISGFPYVCNGHDKYSTIVEHLQTVVTTPAGMVFNLSPEHVLLCMA